MRRLTLNLLVVTALLVLAAPLTAYADNLTTYGDTVIVTTGNGTVWRSTSDLSGVGYGGLQLEITTPLTLSSLTQLSIAYQQNVGTFVGGAPRFTIFDNSFNGLWVYFGNTPSLSDPCAGGPCNTGNYADLLSPDARFYSNNFGGVNSPNTGLTFAAITALAPSTQISYITVDLDAGWSATQQVEFWNFVVNNTTYNPTNPNPPVPEPASIALLGTGLLTLAGIARKRRMKSRK